MAIRYVKDFEFPSAAGFTDSATKVTGQMYAKGGEAKAPKGKGVMLIIGMGSPKGPMKKAEGGYSDMGEYMSELEKKSPIQSGSYGKKKPEPKKKAPPKSYIPGTNVEASDIMDADERARLERGYNKGGKIKYEDGGKDTSVSVKDVKSGKVKQSKDADYYREMEQMKKPAFKKGGAMKHEDEAMDRKLVKQMIKPAALKKMGGGMAQDVQMAKSNAISKSMKGQEQTPMAKGGMKRKFGDGGLVPPNPMMGANPSAMGRGMAPPNQMRRPERRVGRAALRDFVPPTSLPPTSVEGLAGPMRLPTSVEGLAGPMRLPTSVEGLAGPMRLPTSPEGLAVPPRLPARPERLAVPPRLPGYESGGKVKSPLQSMGMSPRGMSLKQAKGVPASSRAPMIAPPAMGMNMGQTAPKMGSRGVGVNEGRPGKPDVGAIRAAMAKAATAVNPDASPAMMKRGGKASMSKC